MNTIIKSRSNLFKLLIFSLSFILISCGNNSEASNPNSSEYGNHVEQSPSATMDLYVEGKYYPNLLGNKLKVDGVIGNDSYDRAYKNVEIRIDFYDEDGYKVGSEFQTVYETVNPGSQTSFNLKVKNYSNIESIGLEVIDAESY